MSYLHLPNPPAQYDQEAELRRNVLLEQADRDNRKAWEVMPALEDATPETVVSQFNALLERLRDFGYLEW